MNIIEKIVMKTHLDATKLADRTMIDKACEWLEPVFKNLAGYNCGGI